MTQKVLYQVVNRDIWRTRRKYNKISLKDYLHLSSDVIGHGDLSLADIKQIPHVANVFLDAECRRDMPFRVECSLVQRLEFSHSIMFISPAYFINSLC